MWRARVVTAVMLCLFKIVVSNVRAHGSVQDVEKSKVVEVGGNSTAFADATSKWSRVSARPYPG